MKYSVMFMSVLAFLILNNVQETEAKPKLWCNFGEMFPGKCGKNAKSTCVIEYRKVRPGIPKNLGIGCDCVNQTIPGKPPRHECRCQHHC
ncbi:hypothetical protein Bca4012_017376 [Brassica carinata]